MPPFLQLLGYPLILVLSYLTDKLVLTLLTTFTVMLTFIKTPSGPCLKLTANSSSLEHPAPTEGALSSDHFSCTFWTWALSSKFLRNDTITTTKTTQRTVGCLTYQSYPPSELGTNIITGQPSLCPTSYTDKNKHARI